MSKKGVRYLLSLGLRATDRPPTAGEIGVMLARRGYVTSGSGFELVLGQGRLRAERSEKGLLISFPLGLSDVEGERAIDESLALAADVGGDIFDFQLGTVVGPQDRTRMLQCWKETYHVQLGLLGPEVLGPGMPEQAKSHVFWRWVKVVAVVGGLMWLTLYLQCQAFMSCVKYSLGGCDQGRMSETATPARPAQPARAR